MRSWTLRYAVIIVHPGLVLYLRCVANVNGLERDVRLICHVVRQIELVGRISHGDLMDLADVDSKRQVGSGDLEGCVFRLTVEEYPCGRGLLDILVTRLWISALGIFHQPHAGGERSPQCAMVSSLLLL